MTGVRTEWHLAALTDTEQDPFGDTAYSLGVTLDLTASEDGLAKQLVGLLYREGRMALQGLTCDLKDNGQDCRDCPAATLDPDQARSVLCRLGKDERALELRLDELKAERGAPLSELVELADEASEIGALPDELAELITEVGL